MNEKNFFYIESYGCQMNVSDTEIIISILLKNGFLFTENLKKANIILLNTCAIREKAELTIKNRLQQLIKNKKKSTLLGILGCLSKISVSMRDHFSNIIDFSVGPDSYKSIPNIISSLMKGKKNPKIFLKNQKETYSDVNPFRKKNKITTFLSITRGCNNMCSFCIVPFTRGRERSRNPYSIIEECKNLYKNGFKEVTLLGQNVDSYLWINDQKTIKINNDKIDFSNLLDLLATEIPFMRIRFSTSNPHDMSDKVIEIISKYSNICKHIHLPVQSGSNKILKLMNRKYTREKYLSLIKKIRSKIPECSISHDIITGFCDEEEKDHQQTISLMNEVKYNYGYMFSYSPRPGTYAYRKLKDNVPEYIKKRRLREIIDLQRNHSFVHMKKNIGKIQEVLIEGESKKNDQDWYGKTTQNTVVVFPKFPKKYSKIGETVFVKIIDCTSATLIGKEENK
ncbi:MAG: tRNA (N6-isopentenyl adenosine(37)-C2)-methylthiotransferase MiaB [Flavobacteriales bacterium]|jgi:tRNA-2-methylthio-N6-dimethylallyladenosine synthase|uniref:tRNA (N6-isopentenyl adenosine(37)-C2)-methylthiotransferase MiaB n=1 Tax=Blattabacterium sp. (Mastotermes darwiniensis) TaxID=39768 RepID=UPI000231DE8F|nr:tRNA (N6-isopentenyl adenosine(37)-C2)-methylthiotransferase MiaB [Blattabacterium sp. (Mastotermes darwiniensis)]AER40707.1 RNA modification protein [Blattabacterium sp. (Mastotermes darwiniensis) str. MADAR]MDR1804765.1 tRNA (N6-isopentenyl adenosine(37)-C2)-methylthiotransferase MiaB [Flavobacteriales bacterium]